MSDAPKSFVKFLLRHAGWVIVTIALILRLIYMLEVSDSPYFASPILDAARYDSMAQEIAAGNWMGDEVFFQGPLYSYFLAVLYALFGHNYFVSRLVQIVLSALTALFVYLIAKRHLHPSAAFAAGLICALYGPLIYYSNQLLIPTLYIFLITLSIYWIEILRDKPTPRNVILTGLLLGLSALARPNILIFMPFLLVWMFFIQKMRLRRLALFCAGFLLVILPVTIRNYAVSRNFVLLSSQGGVAFYMGNNPQATGFTGWVPGTSRDWWGKGKAQTDQIAEDAAGAPLQASQISSYWFDRSITEMSAKPGKWLQLFGKKIKYLLSGYEISDTEDIYYERNSSALLSLLLWNGWVKFPYGLLVPFALFGFLLCFRWPQQSHLLLFQSAYALSIVLYFVTARYRLPLAPIFAIWSAAGVSAAITHLKSASYQKLLLPAIALLLSLILLNLNPEIRKTGDHIEAVTALGTTYLNQGENEKALASFQQVLDFDSTVTRAANSAGVAAVNLGEPSVARGYFKQALRHDPYHKDARLNLARLQHQAGQLDAAVANLQAAIQIDTTFGAAYAALGGIFFDTEKYLPAIELYQLADRYGASDTKLLNRWTKALFIEKRIPEAILINLRLVEVDPDNPMVHYNQGLFYLAADSLAQAETSFKRVLELDPGNTAARKRLKAIRALK